MQRPTARHFPENMTKWDVSIKSVPSDLRESHRRGRRKSGKATGLEDTRRTRPSESTKQGAYALRDRNRTHRPTRVYTRSSVYISISLVFLWDS